MSDPQVFTQNDLIQWGRDALELEAAAIRSAGARLGAKFAEAAHLIMERTGKVIVTGLGKSGHVARKVASTMASTGTSAFYLHPTEALHGDFGMMQAGDCVIALAFGGETPEVIEVCKFARRLGIPVIAVTGKPGSSLATLSNVVLDGSVEREADPLNLAPTASSTVAVAICDALAVAVMRARGFSSNDFAALHPGGSLGRRLSVVKDHMKSAATLPLVNLDTDFQTVLEVVMKFNFGIAAVVDREGHLVGAISDGDIRRAIHTRKTDALGCRAEVLMTRNPKTITPGTLAIDALNFMNEKQITQLFVLEGSPPGSLVGLIRLHDLLAAKIV